MREEILGFLQKKDVDYRRDLSLREISTVKIGGVAALVVYPYSHELLIDLLKLLTETKIKYKILGRMSNVLPPDEGYDGVIIRTDLLRRCAITDRLATVDVGVSLSRLSRICRDAGLSGLEELSGIPASLGGAIYGNAGAYGREIGDLVESVSVYDLNTAEKYEISCKSLNFAYRDSSFKNSRFVILSAVLRLTPCQTEKIKLRMSELREKRIKSQPIDRPSLGSTFKRVKDYSMLPWQMIDGCGLRGFRVGGAMISAKHTGFIVNDGGATAADYLAVADYAERCVKEKYGITLKREFEIL